MSIELKRFQYRNPMLWHMIEDLVGDFKVRTGSFDREYLKEIGVSYTTFSTYASGRTEMPGWVIARIISSLTWDWPWRFSPVERVILADAMVWDRQTQMNDRLRAMALYFGVFREKGDLEGHNRLVRRLRDFFPAQAYPMEQAAIAHDELLMDQSPASAEQTMERWENAYRLFLETERQGGRDDDLKVAILRDMASRLAGVCPATGVVAPSLLKALLETKSRLLACESLIPIDRRSFHYQSLVFLEAALRNYEAAGHWLELLKQSCGPDADNGSGLWLRYDMACAFLQERRNGFPSARPHLQNASERLKSLGHKDWEAHLLRRLLEGA